MSYRCHSARGLDVVELDDPRQTPEQQAAASPSCACLPCCWLWLSAGSCPCLLCQHTLLPLSPCPLWSPQKGTRAPMTLYYSNWPSTCKAIIRMGIQASKHFCLSLPCWAANRNSIDCQGSQLRPFAGQVVLIVSCTCTCSVVCSQRHEWQAVSLLQVLVSLHIQQEVHSQRCHGQHMFGNHSLFSQ